MLFVSPLGPGAAAYYFQGQAAGEWVGRGIGALDLAGEVAHADLVAALRGCHPRERTYLPARKPARRRGGWDLALAAPKSVSLLAALVPDRTEAVAAAHRAAVVDMLAEMESRYIRAGAIAAAFEHRVNAAGEPHLHTHLVLANLARYVGGSWSALAKEWWTARRALGAMYQLGLRYHLAARGFDLDWRLREDGLADLAEVPRAAIRSTSSRRLDAVADQSRFSGAGADGPISSGVRRGGRVRTRAGAEPHRWLDRSSAAGFGPEDASRLSAPAGPGPGATRRPALTTPGPELERAVTARLASWRSSFRQRDVVVALAGCLPAGCRAADAGAWADQYCHRQVARLGPPGAPPRWTTTHARAADERLQRQLELATPLLPVPVHLLHSTLERHELAPGTHQALERLLASAGPAPVLAARPGRSNLLAHAALVELAAGAWTADGRRVAVHTATARSAERWRTLTGIEPYAAHTRADIVIVDHADRRTSPELLALLARIERSGAVPILIEGGTSPRLSWMRSDAVAEMAAANSRVDPGPTPSWTAGGPGGADIAHDLVVRWAGAWPSAAPAVLVGLGPPEVEGLNRAARAVLAARGEIGGPALGWAGPTIQAGDRLLALRRSATGIAPGTVCRVAAVEPERGLIRVQSPEAKAILDRAGAASFGYAYATTPALASRLPNPLLVLGTSAALGRQRERVVMARSADPPEVGMVAGRSWS